MNALALYCKSYSTDLRRIMRLTQSVQENNIEKLPFYVSVPGCDLGLFQHHLHGFPVQLLADEDIIRNNPSISLNAYKALPGHISQQIVKSEFWRLCDTQAYLCLDSDSVFIRPFGQHDYVSAEGIPYTVINEAQDLQHEALRRQKMSVLDNFAREAQLLQTTFQRAGKAYSFGPMPMVWHRAVWESLSKELLEPQGINFLDAILQAPLESRWYGEALLKFKAVPLLPCEPFFKVYHYAWQLDQDQKQGITKQQLARLYSGVIYQSAWERELDWPAEGGNTMSRFGRRIRRALGRI
nr:DUF6492 family protein [uncultured Rhodoferax sp.]